MNDDELTRLFRSLDEPAEPRTAFADTLFADLERMTSGAVARRQTSVRWLLLAATLLLVASLGAALAVGSGLVKLPLVVAVASPTPLPSASTVESVTPTPSATGSASPTSLPATPAPTPSPISVAMSSSATFSLLPTAQPADFVSHISCNGPIGPSDPVALVYLHGTGPGVALRDYADPASPRTACTGLDNIAQLIDARHVVIQSTGAVFAVVDLPEVSVHWFALPQEQAGSRAEFLAVAPGLDQIAWESSNTVGAETAERKVHLTTAAGDQVVAALPSITGGRCGGPDDSQKAAYTHSGADLYVLDQVNYSQNVLLVLEGTKQVLSVAPPPGGAWPLGGHPAMAVWSPVSETLFYRQDRDIWKWTPGSDPQRYLPGVAWLYPTITPDGGHLAYAVPAPNHGHDVYLVDLAHDGSPQLIGKARNLPVFLNSSQLWFKSEAQTGCLSQAATPLVYDINDGSESPSIIDWVRNVWPATSSQNY
jgi:hypothetical protein